MTALPTPYFDARYRALLEENPSWELHALYVGERKAVYAFERNLRTARGRLTEHDFGVEAGEVRAGAAWTKIREIRPDVVAVSGYGVPGMWKIILGCWWRRIPVILYSDSKEDDAPRVWWKESVKKLLLRLCSSALVAGTPHAAYLCKLGFPREKIFTPYDVVDVAYFAEEADRIRRSAVRDRDLPGRYFLAVARFVPTKNLPALVNAYALYREECRKQEMPAWSLVLLGDGPLRSEILASITEKKLADWVHLPGFRQYPAMPTYFAQAEAFIHASVVEQWGLVVNEAMASSLPILLSAQCGCACDLLREGENGFGFDPRNVEAMAAAMMKMQLLSEEKRRQMGARAHERVAESYGLKAFAHGFRDAARAAGMHT